MKTTKQVIASMLLEPVGHSVLDSGGAYGWAHDKNKKAIGDRDPIEAYDSTPAVWVEFDARTHDGKTELEIDITKSVYHHCVETLDYNERLDRMLQSFSHRESEEYNGWPETIEHFLKYLSDKGIEVGGLYGEDEPFGDNTYNRECILSQTLQYTVATIGDEAIIILQVHGGCDVRGGYTEPRVFNGDDSFLIYNDASIYCGNCHAAWYTDDGYHWYPANSEGKLESFEVLDRDDFEHEECYFAILNSVSEIPDEQDALPGFDRPKFVRDENHVEAILVDGHDAYCPYCHGQLKA